MSSLLNDSTSIYLQIADFIEKGILREAFAEDTRVPSTNELAGVFSINPATAAKALNLLVDDGILYKKRGLGMYVAANAREIVRVKRRKQFYGNFVRPMAAEARGLAMTDAELSEIVRRALDKEDQAQAAERHIPKAPIG